MAFVAAPAFSQLPVAAPSLVALAPAGGNIPVDLKVSVLGAIPDNAYGFAVLSDAESARQQVESLLHKLKIPFDTTREYADFNDSLERLEGWDSKGQHAFALLPGEDKDDPIPLIFVPVTDYAKFAASVEAENTDGSVSECKPFGERSLIAEKSGYAVFTEPGADETLFKEAINNKKSVVAACEPIRSWLTKQQAAAVVLPSTVKFVADEGLKALEEAKKLTDGSRPVDDEFAPYAKLGEVARKFGVKFVETVRDDLTHLTFSLKVDDKSGLAVSSQAVFKAGGQFQQVVGNSAPLPADCLRNLPAEQFILSAAYAYPKGLTQPLFQLLDDVLGEAAELKDLPVDIAKIREGFEISRKLVNQLNFIAQTQSTTGPGIYDGVYGIYDVENADEFLDQNEAGLKAFVDAFNKFKDKFKGMEISRKKVGEVDALVYTMDILALMEAFGQEAQPQQDAVMKAMFGGEGKMTIYLAAATKTKVVMAYGEKGLKTIVESVKADKPGLADDVMIKKTAALLPREVTAVGYIDIGGYIEFVKKMVVQMMAAQGAAFPLPIPPFPEAPPIGYTFKTRDNLAQVDMVVPLELMEATRDYVEQVQALIGAFAPR
ncbi:MAG: hypothetical protein QM775_00785 [Pirellulales bacterium]